MFNKLKQFKDLKDQAKKIQGVLAAETVSAEKKGIKVTMNGSLEVLSVTLGDLPKSDLEKYLPEAFNDAARQAQKIMAKKMQEMGGLSGLGL
jgi:DNA-binding protein YbaB